MIRADGRTGGTGCLVSERSRGSDRLLWKSGGNGEVSDIFMRNSGSTRLRSSLLSFDALLKLSIETNGVVPNLLVIPRPTEVRRGRVVEHLRCCERVGKNVGEALLLCRSHLAADPSIEPHVVVDEVLVWHYAMP